jgi:DNA-binding LacI/PurR family transcriptional regulator
VSVTIAEVAARAGVSIATVSRVLTGMPGARPETRERVLLAARQLQYRPSGVAQSLKRRATRTLGLIITDIANPFFPDLVRAVEDAARDAGYTVLLCNGADDPEREAAYLELLARRRVDGMIVASSALTEHHGRWLTTAPLPAVLVNCADSEGRLPAILSDSRDGGRQAAAHLLGLGHRRLGHIRGPRPHAAAAERQAGVLDALADAGVDQRTLVVVEGDGHVEGGERAARELLRSAPDTTAIACYNDLTAIGALRAVRALGLAVPGEVSVVGFDDIDMARYVDPPLTTIAQQTEHMGRWAVQALIGGDEPSPRAEMLPVHLVVRGSTAPPRG